MKNNPTAQTYEPLYNLIEKINNRFFDGKLPPVLLTLQRQPRVFGYMSIDRFVNSHGEKAHELAINPDYFPIYPLTEIMQTLAHELVHLAQFKFGKPSRKGYHNKEFAKMMEDIGLMASSTGQEGGKKTGQNIADYIIKGGVFEQFCNEVLESDFKIEWFDRFPPRNITPKKGSFMYQAGHAVMTHDFNSDFEILSISNNQDNQDNQDGDVVTFEFNNDIQDDDITDDFAEVVTAMFQPEPKKQTRYKFTCPECKSNLWGKPSLKVLCIDCDQPYQVQGSGAEIEE